MATEDEVKTFLEGFDVRKVYLCSRYGEPGAHGPILGGRLRRGQGMHRRCTRPLYWFCYVRVHGIS